MPASCVSETTARGSAMTTYGPSPWTTILVSRQGVETSSLRVNPTTVGSADCHVVSSVFTSVLAKHPKSFSLVDCISVGVDRMQRSFEPMRKQL